MKSGRKFGKMLSAVAFGLLATVMLSNDVSASSVPIYNGIPAYQQKDFYETATVTIKGLTIKEIVDSKETTLNKEIRFEIFNSTKQEIEAEVVSSNGKLPDLKLIKNHNYIITALDSEYEMDNMYVWVNGAKIVNIKEIGDIDAPTYDYPEVTSLCLQKRKTEEMDLDSVKRVFVNLPVCFGEGKVFNIPIKLVSAYETIETSSGDRGYLRESLIEDVPYMVFVDHKEYGVQNFPLVVKDKSEYGAGKYRYDFSSCKMVESIQLVKKSEIHSNDTSITSLSGNVTLSGMNFKDFLVLDKKLDLNLDAKLKGKIYEVRDIILVNPHRWEIGRFPEIELGVSINNIEKEIENAYYLIENNELQPVEFKVEDQKLYFTANQISLYPLVIQYEGERIVLKVPASASAVLSGGYDDVKFSWKKVENAAGYDVYMKKSTAKSYTYLGQTTKLNYTKKNLSDGVKYTFKVVPYHYEGDIKVKGTQGKTASVYTLKKLNTPKVTKAGAKKVTVSWSNISGESGYQISKSTKKTGTNIISTYTTTTGKSKTFIVTKNKTYYYKVRAYKSVNGKKIYGPWSSVRSYRLK